MKYGHGTELDNHIVKIVTVSHVSESIFYLFKTLDLYVVLILSIVMT